ncbi:MBL fold metallo-hydrolase [Hwanghaeella sp.]|uniref:MBL fold metallo-hydrolase n=1 Tax=Hwanghaeella sp. TaxID=2605943 RepID=UPI003CCC2692
MTHMRQDGMDYLDIPPPGRGEVVEVAPGVHWIRMPLPMALDHINLWLLEDEDPADRSPTWTIVDTGMASNLTKDLWTQIFNGPAASRRPMQLICTHYHPDHFGLAGWLAETYDLAVRMTDQEWTTGTLLWRVPAEEFATSQDRFLARHCVPREIRDFHLGRGNAYDKGVGRPPESFLPMEEGEILSIGGRGWRVITVGGHTPAQAVLYCEQLNVLISGDQILPQISPIVSVWWYRSGISPLPDFLNSISKCRSLPQDALVLPSHRQPFRSLHRRIDELLDHHRDRLQELRDGLRDTGTLTTLQAKQILFPRIEEPANFVFAIGETVAHLEHLVRTGELTVETQSDKTLLYRQKRQGKSFETEEDEVQELHF